MGKLGFLLAMKLIGFIGRKTSGKDTAAQILVDNGYENVKFAGALKFMLRAYFTYLGLDDKTIQKMIDGRHKEIPTWLLEKRTPRWAMQTLGTEWGRDLIGKEIWVNACIRRCQQFYKVVVTDVRFENEVAGLQGIGGKIIRITRPGTEIDTHESERLIDTLPADFEIVNDSTIDELHAKVLTLVNQHE